MPPNLFDGDLVFDEALLQKALALFSSAPITSILILIQIAILFRERTIEPLRSILMEFPSIYSGALNPHQVVVKKEWYRIVSSCLLHGGSLHLFSNMAELYIHGTCLELKIGTHYYTLLIVFLCIVSNFLEIASLYGMAHLHPCCRHLPQSHQSVGFSGVLFGLLILDNWTHSRSNTEVWYHLVLASIIQPQASFLGHLTGIVAGYSFIPLSSQSNRKRLFHLILKAIFMVLKILTWFGHLFITLFCIFQADSPRVTRPPLSNDRSGESWYFEASLILVSLLTLFFASSRLKRRWINGLDTSCSGGRSSPTVLAALRRSRMSKKAPLAHTQRVVEDERSLMEREEFPTAAGMSVEDLRAARLQRLEKKIKRKG